MHEHDEICLNTSSNCHKGPTQMHKHQMGLSQIKELKIISQKLETQPNFQKSPIFKTLSTDYAKFKKKMLETHTLIGLCRDFA